MNCHLSELLSFWSGILFFVYSPIEFGTGIVLVVAMISSAYLLCLILFIFDNRNT